MRERIDIAALRAEAEAFDANAEAFHPNAARGLVRRLSLALDSSVHLIDHEKGLQVIAERLRREKDITTVWLEISGWLLLREVPEMIDRQLRELRARLIEAVMSGGRTELRRHVPKPNREQQ